jgi:Tfp pilus assembly protein PilX
MRPGTWRTLFRSERGIALPTAMIALMLLTTLLIAFAVLSKSEPTIASNQARAAQARALTEAGVEQAVYALNSVIPTTLASVATAPYNGSCSGSTCSPNASYIALGTVGGFFVQVQAGTANNERIVDAWGWTPTYSSTGFSSTGASVTHKHIHLTLNKMTFINFVPPAGLNVRGELEVGPSNAASVDGATDASCGNKSGTYSTGAATIDHTDNVTGTPPTLQNVPTSTFDQYIFTNSDLDMLKQLAKASGRYLQGSQSFSSGNPLPINGLIFIDTPSGNNLNCTDSPPVTCTNPSSDNITVSISGNAGPGGSGSFNGWLIVNGSVQWTGNTNLNGLIYTQNDLTSGSGTGTISGAVVTRNMQDSSLTSIDTSLTGNKTIQFNCANAKNGGGNVVQQIWNTLPHGWFLKAGTYREVSD